MDIDSNPTYIAIPLLHAMLKISQVLFLLLLLLLLLLLFSFFCIFLYLLVVGVLDDVNGTVLITHLTLNYKVAQL